MNADPAAMPGQFAVLHRDARALLVSWRAPTPQLAVTRERFLRVLDTDPTAMWREHSPVHFTASLVLLDPALEDVALTLHGKAKRWFQFGGHCEAGDAGVAAAALREGREESGIPDMDLLPGLVHIDAHDLPPAFGHCTEHLDLRFGAVARSTTVTTSEESDDVAWWAHDALPEGTEESLRHAIELTRARALRAPHAS